MSRIALLMYLMQLSGKVTGSMGAMGAMGTMGTMGTMGVRAGINRFARLGRSFSCLAVPLGSSIPASAHSTNPVNCGSKSMWRREFPEFRLT